MKRVLISCFVGLTLSCSGEEGGNSDSNGGSGSGVGGAAPSAGAAGASLGGSSGTGAAGGASGSGGSAAAGSGGSSGQAGSGGTAPDAVALPPGSRELDGVVNLVDANAAAELDVYLTTLTQRPYWEGGLNASLNLFLEHYVEEYDFVYFITDHPLLSSAVGRFETVTGPAMPGTGNDFDWEREGYRTNGRVRGVIGVQYRPGQYGPFGHEMLHYWANYLDPSFGFGIGIAEDVGAHWGYAGIRGVLGGFDPASLRCESPSGALPPACDPVAGGRTRYRVGFFFPNDNGVATPCDPFELYLMGLVPLSQAPSAIPILTDAEALYDTYDATTGTLVVEASGMTTVAMSDIVERHGTVRELAPNERAFRAAFVVLSASPVPDVLLAEVAEWAAFHGNRATDPDILSFEALTGGRATLDTRLGARRPMTAPPPAVRIPSGCEIFTQGCGPGKACYFDARSAGLCGLSRGGMRDEPCDESYDCAPGLDCAPNASGTSAACEPYCNADQAAPDACAIQCPWFILSDENDNAVGGICQAPP